MQPVIKYYSKRSDVDKHRGRRLIKLILGKYTQPNLRALMINTWTFETKHTSIIYSDPHYIHTSQTDKQRCM